MVTKHEEKLCNAYNTALKEHKAAEKHCDERRNCFENIHSQTQAPGAIELSYRYAKDFLQKATKNLQAAQRELSGFESVSDTFSILVDGMY